MLNYLRVLPETPESRNLVLDSSGTGTYLNSFLYFSYKLFNIDLINLIKTKASLSKQFSIAPSEVDRMAYWEFEYFLKYLNDMVKEENKSQQKQSDDIMSGNGMNSGIGKQFNKNMNAGQKMINSMPKSININTPKFS